MLRAKINIPNPADSIDPWKFQDPQNLTRTTVEFIPLPIFVCYDKLQHREQFQDTAQVHAPECPMTLAADKEEERKR